MPGATVNARDAHGNTALILAADKGDAAIDVIKTLLAADVTFVYLFFWYLACS